jgi:metallophosphoesterase superfamily enzyme
LHGDQPSAGEPVSEGCFLFMGHEHPAISLSEGVASIKCPCFLVSENVIVLPAFSSWAAGGDVRSGRFLSPVAQAARFTQAVAIVAGKLLPVPLRPRSTSGSARA